MPQPNITPDEERRVEQFSREFNALAAKYDLCVHFTAYIQSKTLTDFYSIQVGGDAQAILLTTRDLRFDENGRAHLDRRKHEL